MSSVLDSKFGPILEGDVQDVLDLWIWCSFAESLSDQDWLDIFGTPWGGPVFGGTVGGGYRDVGLLGGVSVDWVGQACYVVECLAILRPISGTKLYWRRYQECIAIMGGKLPPRPSVDPLAAGSSALSLAQRWFWDEGPGSEWEP